jgi:hypothetical protein
VVAPRAATTDAEAAGMVEGMVELAGAEGVMVAVEVPMEAERGMWDVVVRAVETVAAAGGVEQAEGREGWAGQLGARKVGANPACAAAVSLHGAGVSGARGSNCAQKGSPLAHRDKSRRASTTHSCQGGHEQHAADSGCLANLRPPLLRCCSCHPSRPGRRSTAAHRSTSR